MSTRDKTSSSSSDSSVESVRPLAARVQAIMVEYQRRSVSVRALMAEDPHGDLECCDSTAGCIYEEIANELAAALAEEKP